MDPVKKVKLIYSGELFLFALVFLAIGLLVLFRVIPLTSTRRAIFTWVTIFGGAIGIGDFLWALISKKRRRKVALIDKILVLPAGVLAIVMDVIAFAQGIDNRPYEHYQWTMGSVFCYLGLVYLFLGFYHYRRPIPGLIEDENPKPEAATDEPEKSNQPNEKQ